MQLITVVYQFACSYVALLLCSIVCNAVVARAYGNACGIGWADAADFRAWARVFGLSASPFCTVLLKVCTLTQVLTSYAWTNLFMGLAVAGGTAVPPLKAALGSILGTPGA